MALEGRINKLQEALVPLDERITGVADEVRGRQAVVDESRKKLFEALEDMDCLLEKCCKLKKDLDESKKELKNSL